MAWADTDAEIRHVDELIYRVIVARDEARAHGNTILVEADDRKLDELLELRHMLVVPKQREPEE